MANIKVPEAGWEYPGVHYILFTLVEFRNLNNKNVKYINRKNLLGSSLKKKKVCLFLVLDLCDSHEQCHSWKGCDIVHGWKLAFSKLQGLARSPACGWSPPALFPRQWHQMFKSCTDHTTPSQLWESGENLLFQNVFFLLHFPQSNWAEHFLTRLTFVSLGEEKWKKKNRQAARTVMVKTLSKALQSFEHILLVINLFFFLVINLDVKLKKRN